MSITNITVDFINQIDNIDISFENSIDNISVSYSPEITNIQYDAGYLAQNVYSVNGDLGVVTLTYTETLGAVSSSAGYYQYSVNHQLGSNNIVSSVYDDENQVIIPDVIIIDENNVLFKSILDMNGYRVVIQK